VSEEPALRVGPLVAMGLLLAALADAAVARGAFFADDYQPVLGLLLLAAVLALVLGRPSRSELAALARDPLAAGALALVVVVVLSAAVAGDVGASAATVSLLLAIVALVVTVRSVGPEARRLLVLGIVALATAVAVVGWVAVVARATPEALPAEGLWRAASTLTYENALAAFLTAPVLLCLDRLATGSSGWAWPGATYLLLVGFAATLSRGGLGGLVVGLVVLLVVRRPARLRAAWPLLGAVVAGVALLPSLPTDGPNRPALAAVGLVAGGLLAYGGALGRAARLALAGLVALGAALVVALVPLGHALHVFSSARLTAASSDRAHEWGATLAIARAHLVLGTGAGQVVLHWQSGGQAYVAYFTHNEYLQFLAQYGLVGLVVLAALLAGVLVRLVRSLGRPASWPPEAALAGFAAFLVESAVDFLWHVPVLPLTMAAVVSAAVVVGGPPSVATPGAPPAGTC